MTDNEKKELLAKYLDGSASEQEKKLVESWYAHITAAAPDPARADFEQAKETIWRSVQQRENNPVKLPPPRTFRLRIAIKAAAAIVIIAGGIYFFGVRDREILKQVQDDTIANDIAPGKQGATLTLADGRQIKLTDAADGELAREADVAITKSADGHLVYEILDRPVGEGPYPDNEAASKTNILSTAKGETYQVKLPDGSLVWLNSVSSLTYTAKLINNGQRRIKLDGEAYLEIAKDQQYPFVVESRGQEIEVLGTHFNVNSYTDEGGIQTTLLEGRIAVRSNKRTVVLKPGQQSSMQHDGKIAVRTVDTDEIVAWKNGKFIFNGEHLPTIMKSIAKWYNIEVEYRRPNDGSRFFGIISRDKNISAVLTMLEASGKVKFKIEGRQVIVTE